MSHLALAHHYLMQDQWVEAKAYFLKDLFEKRGKPWNYCNKSEQERFFKETLECPTHLPIHKLKHDADQLKYLVNSGKLPSHFLSVSEAYSSVFKRLDRFKDPGIKMHALLPKERNLLEKNGFQKLIYLEPETVLPSLINPKLDCQKIEFNYLSNPPGFSLCDHVLNADALSAIHQYCLNSTLWFDFQRGGYVGSYLPGGFSHPLILQLAVELRMAFPRILGEYPLTLAWSYKYNSHYPGVGLHADSGGQVNFNLWLTPDEANLSHGKSGLIVYDVMAPADWSPHKHKLQDVIKQDSCQVYKVPYKQNRALFFNSGLFHSSDAFQFKPNYIDSRINLTLLFGVRGAKEQGQHYWA